MIAFFTIELSSGSWEEFQRERGRRQKKKGDSTGRGRETDARAPGTNQAPKPFGIPTNRLKKGRRQPRRLGSFHRHERGKREKPKDAVSSLKKFTCESTRGCQAKGRKKPGVRRRTKGKHHIFFSPEKGWGETGKTIRGGSIVSA